MADEEESPRDLMKEENLSGNGLFWLRRSRMDSAFLKLRSPSSIRLTAGSAIRKMSELILASDGPHNLSGGGVCGGNIPSSPYPSNGFNNDANYTIFRDLFPNSASHHHHHNNHDHFPSRKTSLFANRKASGLIFSSKLEDHAEEQPSIVHPHMLLEENDILDSIANADQGQQLNSHNKPQLDLNDHLQLSVSSEEKQLLLQAKDQLKQE